MGLDSVATVDIEIMSDFVQYIELTTINTDYQGRITYSSTNNDLKMHTNSSSTPALTLHSTYLTTNQVAIIGISGMQSTYAAPGVYLGSIDNTSAGIKLNGPNASYNNYSRPNRVWHGFIDDSNTSHQFQFSPNNSTIKI